MTTPRPILLTLTNLEALAPAMRNRDESVDLTDPFGHVHHVDLDYTSDGTFITATAYMGDRNILSVIA